MGLCPNKTPYNCIRNTSIGTISCVGTHQCVNRSGNRRVSYVESIKSVFTIDIIVSVEHGGRFHLEKKENNNINNAEVKYRNTAGNSGNVL